MPDISPNVGKFFKQKSAKDDRGDPWNNHYFALEIDGAEVAHFQEASGFKSSLATFNIEEGGRNGDVVKRPSQSKWGTITLKVMTSANNMLAEWRDKYYTDGFFEGKRLSCTGAVIVKDNDGAELRRYSMTEVWPVSWEGPALNATASGIGLESLEIAFDQVFIGGIPTEGPAPEPTPAPTPAPEPIQFDFDKSNVKKSEEKKVDDASKIYKKAPAVWVEGHTCDMGTHSYNLKLSAERAASVATSLEQKDAGNGIKRDAYNSSGYSYDHPVKPNNGEGNRAANRRVQIWDTPRSGKRGGELVYKKYPT